MKLRRLIPILLLAVLLAGCFGPKPVVVSYSWQPPAAGSDKPATVEVILKNEGPGAGQAKLSVALKDKQNGDTIVADDRRVDLAEGETIHVTFDLDLPPSQQNIDPANIAVEVNAEYPVE